MRAYYPGLIPALWSAWALYWWIASRGAKPVARRESVGSRLGHIVPLVVAAYLCTARHVPGWLGERFLPTGEGIFLAGVALVVLGLLFTVWARVALGGNWSGTVTLKEGHEIVKTGPYRRIRHPIYTGLLLMFLGSAIARGEWRGLVATVIAFVALWRKLKLEERWLTEHFGAPYSDYCKTSAALIPFIL